MSCIKVGITSLFAELHARSIYNALTYNYDKKVLEIEKQYFNELTKVNHEVEFLPLDKEKGLEYVKWEDYDLLIYLGYFGNSEDLFWYLKNDYPDLKIALAWIGSDVITLAKMIQQRKYFTKCLLDLIDYHLVTQDIQLDEELRKLGINAWLLPAISPRGIIPLMLMKGNRVAFYYRSGKSDEFQGTKFFLKLAEDLDDYEFIIFGRVKKETIKLKKNKVEVLGWLDGDEYLKTLEQCSVLVDLIPHGGLGTTALEFLQSGRYVVTTRPIPYATEVKTYEDLLTSVSNLLSGVDLNREASEFYQKNRSPEVVRRQFNKIMDKILNGDMG